MYKTFTQRLSITKLGKRDEIVKEKGNNNEDGWRWSILADNNRLPAPARQKRK